MAIGKTNAQRKILLTTPSTVTPTKSQQIITTPDGYDGMDSLTIEAIPSNYIDTSAGDATAAQILSGKKAYVDGSLVTGTMTNRGAVSQTLTTSTTSYTVPKGYHNGSGKVSISTQSKSVTPSSSSQTITPDSGKLLSSVIVNGYTPTLYTQKISPWYVYTDALAIQKSQMTYDNKAFAYVAIGGLLSSSSFNSYFLTGWGKNGEQTTFTTTNMPTTINVGGYFYETISYNVNGVDCYLIHYSNHSQYPFNSSVSYIIEISWVI